MEQQYWKYKIRAYTGMYPAFWVTIFFDILTMQAMLALGIFVRTLFGGTIELELYYWLLALVCTGPIFTIMLGASEVPVPPPHKEVQKTFLGISFAYLVILIVLFMGQISVEYSRSILAMTWLMSVVAVPMVRGIIRRRLCQKHWWGMPVVFLQKKEDVQDIWRELEANPIRGLRPEKCMNLDFSDENAKENIAKMFEKYIDPVFIWIYDDVKKLDEIPIFSEISQQCKRLLVVPVSRRKSNKFWLAPRMLGSSTAFLIRQNLTDIKRLYLKRIMDILFSFFAIILCAPLFLILTLWIRCGSKGSAFYAQKRLGQNGKPIKIYKFRTMVKNADVVLKDYLQENEHMRAEWERDQKLRHDPRITRAGKFLRKTSLDELPQLFNVLIGTMALVGPRPIVENEIKRYGDVYLDYKEVKPGITGLWQISGRNNTTYQERISYDRYYVTNWSVWMDLWILMRTIPIVIRGDGAF